MLPSTPHSPEDLQIFSFLEVYFSPPTMQKETIPTQFPPKPQIDLIYVFCYIFLIRTKAKPDMFHNFYAHFPEFIERRIWMS